MDERDANIFDVYNRIVTDEFVQETLAELSLGLRDRIFTCCIVMWLMIYQRLDSSRTLAEVVDRLRTGRFDALLKRRGSLLSPNTGGYAYARERLPLELVRRAADKINDALVSMHKEERWKGLKVYLVDGSSLTLPSTGKLKREYPPCRNQFNVSSWAKVRTLHVHDLVTGVALRPEYGPMFGESAVGELTMLPAVLQRLERGCVVVGDRIYGCFQVAYALAQRESHVLIRMSDGRSKKFWQLLKQPGEVSIKWEPSSHERRKHSELPDDACVEGRFIWHRWQRKGYKPQDFRIFTTLTLPVADIIELYSLRWNIETDLRSIKSTMKLEEIRGKNPDIVAKEIILGHVAYNLIRNVMLLTAQLAKVDPRSLSFSRFMSLISATAPDIWKADRESVVQSLAVWVRGVPGYKLSRKKREPEPRKLLYHASKYPFLRMPREVEKEMARVKLLAA